MSYAEDRKAARDEAVAAHKEAVEAQQTEEVEFHDAGYDETIPGQTEIVSGTPEHERELKAFPNASSYGPHVNVIAAEPVEPEEEPPVQEPEIVEEPTPQPSRY